jgi:hypothetical protein
MTPRQPSQGRLFRKYVLLFVGLVGVALVVSGGVDFWFGYQEHKAALVGVQQEKADAAAQRIEEFIGEIERQIGWTTHARWAAGPLDERRFEKMFLPLAADCRGAPPIGLGSRFLKCVASAEIIDGLSAWATLAMTGLVRRRSTKARN